MNDDLTLTLEIKVRELERALGILEDRMQLLIESGISSQIPVAKMRVWHAAIEAAGHRLEKLSDIAIKHEGQEPLALTVSIKDALRGVQHGIERTILPYGKPPEAEKPGANG